MGTRTRNGKNSTSSEVIEVCVPYSSEKCPVQTKVKVPADFDVIQNFNFGFCAANFQKEQPKSYASAVEHTLKSRRQHKLRCLQKLPKKNLEMNRKSEILISNERSFLI